MASNPDFKQRDALIKMIPDMVAAWKEGNKEPLIKLRMEIGARQWHFEKTEKGLSIGESGSSFTRQVTIINPQDREFWTHHGDVKSFVLWFGAYGWTRLLVYTGSLEEALEECAAWLAKYAPGHIMTEYGEDYTALIREQCEEEGEDFDTLRQGENQNEKLWEICDRATQDFTRTESGFITDEWGIALVNPDTETLYQFIHGA